MSITTNNQLDNTEVFDEVDLAQIRAQNEIDALLAAHQEKMKPESHPDFDGKNCAECGVVMPKLRLKMGKVRCVDCQTNLERLKKIFPGKVFD